MNKALVTTLAAAFGLSAAACAGTTDDDGDDNEVKVVMDKDGRLQEDKTKSSEETQGTSTSACMLQNAQGIAIQGGCACW